MIQMYFGKACKEYREEMNISQEKFALSIGMDGGKVLVVTNGRQALRLVPMERNARYVPVRE